MGERTWHPEEEGNASHSPRPKIPVVKDEELIPQEQHSRLLNTTHRSGKKTHTQ